MIWRKPCFSQKAFTVPYSLLELMQQVSNQTCPLPMTLFWNHGFLIVTVVIREDAEEKSTLGNQVSLIPYSIT